MADAAITARPDAIQEPTRIHGSRVKLAEVARNTWYVEVPEEHDPDACLEAPYLWHAHDRLKVGDRVEVVHERGMFYILLLVARIDRETQAVHTRVITAVDWRKQELPGVDLTGAIVEKQGADQWRVRLGSSVLSRNHLSKDDAEAWVAKRRSKG